MRLTGIITLVILLVTACQGASPPDQPTAYVTSPSTSRERVPATTSDARLTSSAPLMTSRAYVTTATTEDSPTTQAVVTASNAALASPAPFRDLTAIVERIRPNACLVAATPRTQPIPAIGSVESFWIDNVTQRTHERIAAVLRWISPHALWYVQQGL
ncbi:MAG: hypothetical protein M1298_02435, partial [Chloroflexi bacterium]|nr:hypothetical protein [Chloroflexota bacterium]